MSLVIPPDANASSSLQQCFANETTASSPTTPRTTLNSDNIDIPKHCWTRRLDEPLPPPSLHTFSRPPILEALSLLPVAARVGRYILSERKQSREPIFDLSGLTLSPPNPGPHGGVPLGGIGSGSIGRSFDGTFRRLCLHPNRCTMYTFASPFIF